MNKFWEYFGVGIVLFGVLGWILNVIAIGQSEVLNGFLFLRLVGVLVAPLGAILGYL